MDFIHSSIATHSGEIKPKYSRSAKTKPWMYFSAIAVIIIVLILATSSQPNIINTNPTIKSVIGQNIVSTSTTNTAALCSTLKTLQLTVLDGLASATVNAPTLNIYNGLGVVETPTVSSSGVATTANKYQTGQNLILKYSGASLVTEYLPVTVPPIACGDTSTSNAFTVYAVTLGSWTITLGASGGTVITSGGQYYLSQFPAGASGLTTITVTMSESNNNQGYKTNPDIVNSLTQNMVVQLKDTATAMSVQGLPHALTVGTTRYWLVSCPDGITGVGYSIQGGQGAFQQVSVPGQSGGPDSFGSTQTNAATGAPLQYPGYVDSICAGSLSQQKLGNTVYGGVASFSFQVTAGSLASGSSETISITMNDYSNINYFLATTSLGPNTAAVGAPQGSSQGTAFSLKLMNG